MKKTRNQGFTLLELLLTIGLAAVVLGIAAPNFTRFAKNNRLTGSANDMLAAMYVARTEAIKQQVPVTMCFTTTPMATTPTCNGDGMTGWITWIDLNGDAIVDSPGEEIKVRHDALPATTTLVVKPALAKLVSYGANGFSRAVANTLSGVVMCDDRKNAVITGDVSAARGLVVEQTGRPSITKSYNTIRTSSSLLDSASSGACVG